MRKTVLFLLLASAAVPALAADEPGDRSARREAARAERGEARAERRSERAQPSQASQEPAEARSAARSVDRPPAVREPQRQVIERVAIDRPAIDRQIIERPAIERPAIERQAIERRVERNAAAEPVRRSLEQRLVEPPAERNRGARSVRPALEERGEAADSVREWRRAEREQLRADRPAVIEQRTRSGWEALQQRREQRAGRDSIGNRRAPVVSRVPREGTQPPPPATPRVASLTTQHWRGDWRHDGRYDWRKHRNRYRWLFQLGFYLDPFGWGYRPYSIGWRLWPSYYRSSYWLHDPWQYRLPYAPAGYRWIRYYDDALLVDTWDGTVVDVIHNFFW